MGLFSRTKKEDQGGPVPPGDTTSIDQDLKEGGFETVDLGQSTSELAAKHGATDTKSTEAKREKWRLDKVRQRQKEVASTGKVPADPPPGPSNPGPDRPLVLPSTIRSLCHDAFSLLNSIAKKFVGSKVIRITRNRNTPGGDRVLSADFERRADIGPERHKQLTDAATAVCIKYSIIGDNAPEIALGFGLLAWAGELAMMVSELNRLVERVEAQHQNHEPKN